MKTYVATREGTSFVVVLFEGGQTRAVIEADMLGQLRTGAASGRRCEVPCARRARERSA